MFSSKKRIMSAALMLVITACAFLSISAFKASTALVPTVMSTSNASNGVKVVWEKDTSKSGYYVYRKSTTSSEWTKIKTVKGGSYSSWTDTSAVNGEKYNYKVEAYKGDTVYTNKTKSTICRLSRPSIKSLSYDGDSIHITGSKNSSAGGFEIKYSTSSDFSNSKTLTVWTTQIDKTLANLSCSKTYYFKIRAFRISNNVYYYSTYSKVKSYKTKASYTAYTANLYTSIYKEPDSYSQKISLDYMTEVRLYQDYYVGSEGNWRKLKYNGKYYYAWVPRDSSKFTKVKNKYEYDTSACNKYQKEIVELALDIFKNRKTEYDYTKEYSDGSINEQTNSYPFDCSGLVRYVHNTVMQKYIKSYKIPWNIIELFDTTTVYNNGLSTEFNATIVCQGEYDYSKLQPGDVLFFNLSQGRVQGKVCNHCGIYLGDGQFVHSMGSLSGVAVSIISGTYEKDFVKAVRYIPEEIELANLTLTAPRNIALYDDMRCKTGTSVYKIPKNKSFTLVCTNENVGYVTYIDDDGGEHCGYIYKPQNLYTVS